MFLTEYTAFTEWTGLLQNKPWIYAIPVELVETRQHPQTLKHTHKVHQIFYKTIETLRKCTRTCDRYVTWLLLYCSKQTAQLSVSTGCVWVSHLTLGCRYILVFSADNLFKMSCLGLDYKRKVLLLNMHIQKQIFFPDLIHI